MKRSDKQIGVPETVYKDTQSQIEALTSVVAGSIAMATDTGEFGYYNGSDWMWFPIEGGDEVVSYFMAYRTADQTPPNNTNTVVQFTNTGYNYGSDFNTSTYRWIAPQDGYGVFCGSAFVYSPNSNGFGYGLLKNGSPVSSSLLMRLSTPYEHSIIGWCYTLPVSSADYFQAYVWRWDDGLVMPWASTTNFSGILFA